MIDRERDIRERLAKRTPGEWRLGTYNVWQDESGRWICDTNFEERRGRRHTRPDEGEDDANADLIANAPADLQYLLSLLNAERQRSAHLVAVLRRIEWGDETSLYCPGCGRAKREFGRNGEHTYDCPVGLALKEQA